MTKLCPFMSFPVAGFDEDSNIRLVRVPCEGVDCMAWEDARYGCLVAPECPDLDETDCSLDTCPKAVKVVTRVGYCRLIDMGGA